MSDKPNDKPPEEKTTTKTEAKPKTPYLIEASSKTLFRFGYKDARCEVGLRLPLGIVKWMEIEAEDLGIASDCLKQAMEWAELPEEVRKDLGAK